MVTQFVVQNFNTIGIIGVILVLVAYLLLQIDKLKQDSVTYSLLNLVGSFLILVSLYFTWNLASGIIEIAWFLISLFGLIKAFYFLKKTKTE